MAESDEREIVDEINCTVSLWTPNRQSQITIQAFPLPAEVREFLTEKSSEILKIKSGKMDENETNKIRNGFVIFSRKNR